jgi:hypothetical protein
MDMPLPNFTIERNDILLASLVASRTEVWLATRPKDRTERELAPMTYPTTEKLDTDPKAAKPFTLAAPAICTKDRTESELCVCTWCATEHFEPNRNPDRTDKDEPDSIALKILSPSAKLAKARTLKPEAMLLWDNTLIAPPMRPKLLADKLDPTCMLPKIEAAPP